ncbi:MAG TPA: efflux RND transporter periplasmic adaptor subunit [Thioalkalivibrio sp.]|nr:efflux RND transporter periplasmic adaptor subunit [Thioalkalivibrio sp.]
MHRSWLRSRFLRLPAGLCLAAAALAAGAADVPFETLTLERSTVAREQVLDGAVEAVHQATMSAQTSGRIVEILYDVDDFVPEGEVIIRFRDTEQQAGYQQAQAALAEARARFNQASSEYERIKGIYERQLVAKAQLDNATAELRAARARLEAAQAGLESAEEQLEYTRVRAPYSGIVTERHVELGENASVGQPLITGISLDRLRVVTQVPQRLINAVRESGKARILLNGEQSVEAGGMTFFPYADAATNTFKVRLALEEGGQGLFPGMFVKVAFNLGEVSRLVVPREAVVYRSEVTGVYVVYDDGRIALRHVRLGRLLADGQIEVLAGLSAGERIALDPVRAGIYLKTGQVAGARDE